MLKEKKYLFSWSKVPKNDSELRKFLMEDFNVSWVKNADISKTGDGKTIVISADNKRIEITCNAERGEVTLKTPAGRTYGFQAIKEKGKLNIYEEEIPVSAEELLKIKFDNWRGVYGSILKDLRGGIFRKVKDSDDVKRIKEVAEDFLKTYKNDYHKKQGMLILRTICRVKDGIKKSEYIDTKLNETIIQLENKYRLNENEFPRDNYHYYFAAVVVDDD